MAIRSGIGIGEAQIFDTSGIMNTYFKLIQQQQKEQDKYEKELADAISKVDLKNLDPTDSKYILDQYGSVKDLYSKLSSIKDRTKQRLAVSQIQKSMDEINEYANGARNYRANLVKVADTMNNNPYDYDPESKEEVARLVNLPYAEAIKIGRASINPMTYRRIPDVSMVDKSMDEMRKMLEATSKDMGAFTVEKAKQPGWTIPVYKSDANEFTKLMAMELAANSKLRFQYKELYNQMNPGAQQPNELQLADFAKSMYEKKYGSASYRFAGEAKPPKDSSLSKTELKQMRAQSDRVSVIGRLKSGDQSALSDVLDISDLPYGSSAVYVTGKDRNNVTRKSVRVRIPKSEFQSLIESGIDISKYPGLVSSADKKEMVIDFTIDNPDFERGFNTFLNKFTPGVNVQYKDIKQNITTPVNRNQKRNVVPGKKDKNL